MAESEAPTKKEVNEAQKAADEAKGVDSKGPTPYSGVPRVESEVDPYDPIVQDKDVDGVRLQGPANRGDQPPVKVRGSEQIKKEGAEYAKSRPGA